MTVLLSNVVTDQGDLKKIYKCAAGAAEGEFYAGSL